MNAAKDDFNQDDWELNHQVGPRRNGAPRELRLRRPQRIKTRRQGGFAGKHRRRNRRYFLEDFDG